MKLSVNWLRELVDLPESVDELCERMTLLGLEVEAVEPFELSFPNVVVGRVVEAVAHPDADKLRLCQVDVGDETLGIVCGAPNVRQGIKVAVAKVGAVLPGNFKIKKSKIRGQVSLGMICSEKELGLGQGQDGIMELETDAAPGSPIDDIFGHRDTVIEIEVTPNRPDWLSHIGVARELAAYYRTELRVPKLDAEVEVRDVDEGWSIRIEDPSACHRFRGRLIDGIKVGPSPLWMRQRLIAIGQRPINAIVDASNYVLHECGHPNHCFDRDKLEGQTVILRRAAEGESFTTLDDIERELNDRHLLVSDAKGGIALAGIMGGGDSEVDDDTTKLLLEVAVFDPQTIRQGRRSVNLSTDASYRFERGVDFEAVAWASARVTQLILDAVGGTAHPVAIEAIGSRPARGERFFVRQRQIGRLLGTDLDLDTVKTILTGLEIGCELGENDGQAGVWVVAPSFRHDLWSEVDVVEELARHYGFDRLPERSRVPMVAPAKRRPDEQMRQRLRRAFAARGLHEMMGSAFMRETDLDALGLAADHPLRSTISVLNPVVQGESMLRTTAAPEMARTVDRNRRRGFTGPIRLFQIARTYTAIEGSVLPEEREQLVVAWSGDVRPLHPAEPARDVDLFDALGDLEGVLAGLGMPVERKSGLVREWLRTGSGMEIWSNGVALGTFGELAPTVRRQLDVEAVVLLAELDLEAIIAATNSRPSYRPFSSFPPSRRDLSLVVPRSTEWKTVRDAIAASTNDLLESCELFDVYEGEDLDSGCVAFGVRLSLRSQKATLKDKRVDKLISSLLNALAEDHGIRLRSDRGATES